MKVAFRADASIEIGSGHVMRCLALADLLRQRGAETCFLTRPLAGHLGASIKAHGHSLIWIEAETMPGDAEACAAALKATGPWDWLVVDHYGLDLAWERAMRQVANRIMVIDDLANRAHDCDLLLDQNLHREPEGRYAGLVPTGCTKLIGPRYALLRREFAEARRKLRPRTGEVRRLLVCFGGSDPHGATLMALEAIQRLDRPDIAVDVVIGSANPHRTEIERACRALPQAKLHCDVEDMASLMLAADLFVGSGGSITWERCCLGLPGFVLACASNQESIAQAVAERGGHRYLGLLTDVSELELVRAISRLVLVPKELLEQSETCMSLVDGYGIERVYNHLMAR